MYWYVSQNAFHSSTHTTFRCSRTPVLASSGSSTPMKSCNASPLMFGFSTLIAKITAESPYSSLHFGKERLKRKVIVSMSSGGPKDSLQFITSYSLISSNLKATSATSLYSWVITTPRMPPLSSVLKASRNWCLATTSFLFWHCKLRPSHCWLTVTIRFSFLTDATSATNQVRSSINNATTSASGLLGFEMRLSAKQLSEDPPEDNARMRNKNDIMPLLKFAPAKT